MERLTNSEGKCLECAFCIEITNCKPECSAIDDCINKLKIYEDFEEQGLLLRLPCADGAKVFLARKCLAPGCEKCRGYLNVDNCITKYKGRIFEQKFDFRYHLVPFGKTVFFTYDAAYCALCKQSGLSAVCKDTKTGYVCEHYKESDGDKTENRS